MALTDEEKTEIAPYVTNVNGNVFCVVNLPGVAGPVFARYSRAPGGFRETMLREFIKKGFVDSKKAEEFIDRVLIGYGDDSVGELEGQHISFEDVSNLATKVIEDRRLGAFIEQSSRYVVYDQKDENGRFRYHVPKEVEAAGLTQEYRETMDFMFQTYVDLVGRMVDVYKTQKPMEEATYEIRQKGQKDKLSDLTDEQHIRNFKTTYNNDIKTKACDTVRILLPAATKTNVGVLGNGRFLEHLLVRLYSHELQEMQDLGAAAHTELNKVIPKFVGKAKSKYEVERYHVETEAAMHALAADLLKGTSPRRQSQPVVLLDSDPSDFSDNLVAEMLFKYAQIPTEDLRTLVQTIPEETKRKILKTYNGNRRHKKDRPGRALEFGYPLTFDLEGDFGIFRDLHRHRKLTLQRQQLTPYLGHVVSQDLADAGFKDKVEQCVEKSAQLYEKLKTISPAVAEYAVLFANNLRWRMGMNLREAMHMLELRTIPQGHPSYRKVAQEMHNAIRERFGGEIANMMSFVDHNSYSSARGESEAGQRRKEADLEARLGKSSSP